MLSEMKKEDLKTLARIYFDIFTGDEWRFDWLTFDNALRYLEDMFAAPVSLAYTLRAGGEIIGGCFGDYSDYFKSPQYYIKEIFIRRDMQRSGEGSRFLAEIELCLKKRGVASVTLLTSKKIPAYDFYHRNGYADSIENVFLMKILK